MNTGLKWLGIRRTKRRVSPSCMLVLWHIYHHSRVGDPSPEWTLEIKSVLLLLIIIYWSALFEDGVEHVINVQYDIIYNV